VIINLFNFFPFLFFFFFPLKKVPHISTTSSNGNVQALMMQLRASEDGRMAALMEMQRIRTQLGYDQDLHLDSKMEV
jgi:hypothetical protein